MSVDTLLIFSGAFVAILPFLGFPQRWDTIFLVLAGIFVVALGIVVRRRGTIAPIQSHEEKSYTQSAPPRYEEEVAE